MRRIRITLSALLMSAVGAPPLTAQVETPVAPIATSEGVVAGKVLPSGVKSLVRRTLRQATRE